MTQVKVMNRPGWYRVATVAVALSLAALLVMPPTSVSALTVTVRPSDVGDATGLTVVGAATNWQAVDDDPSDDDTSYVASDGNSDTYQEDLYNVSDITSAPGKINSVTVYINAKAEQAPTQASAYTIIKISGTTDYGTAQTLTVSYAQYSTPYTTNPSDGSEWTWADVNNLQAGVGLRRAKPGKESRCTQVWVVVDYTPATLESYQDAAHTIVWGTVVNPYDSTYSTAYMNGTNYLPSHSYRIVYYDGNTDNGGDQVVADNQSSTAGYELSSQIILSSYPASTAGTWHAVVYDNEVLGAATPPATYNDRLTTNSYTSEDAFEVLASAIPEFSTVMAGIVVAGMCFGIYYWMRKRAKFKMQSAN